MEIKKIYYYPANFDLFGFCEKFDLNIRKVALFMNLFTAQENLKKYHRKRKLYSKLLKDKIGSEYADIIYNLKEENIIEFSNFYKVGEESRSYWLTNDYYNCEENSTYEYKPNKRELNFEKINKSREEKRYYDEINNNVPILKRKNDRLPEKLFHEYYSPLIENFYSNKFRIEIDEKIYQKALKRKKVRENKFKLRSYKATVNNIKEGLFHLSADQNQRFYSCLTSLPRNLRKAIRVNGEKLVGLDVKNMQPYLLGELCDPLFLDKLVKENLIELNYFMLEEFIEHLNTNPNDLIVYKEIVNAGKIYEEFIGEDGINSRPVVKKNLIKVINDRGLSEYENREKIREIFARKFPTIDYLLKTIKSINHKYMSAVLIRMEAQKLVIWLIQNFYYDPKNENIPIFTVHDCLFTTESNIVYLENWVKKYFVENNIKCSIKRD